MATQFSLAAVYSHSFFPSPPSSGVFHVLAAEDPFTPQLKAFVRVFTAKSEDLQRYEGMSQEALKTEILADKWGKGDMSALQFLIQR